MTSTTPPNAADSRATAQRITVRCQFCQTWNRVVASRAADRPKCGKCGKPILLDRPIPLDDDSFERTVKDAQIPVLVDFYADWCGPCKMMAPFVDQLAHDRQGELLVAKLNTDVAQRTAAQFQIRGIPTTIVFRDGRPVAQRTGAMRLPELEQLVAESSKAA